MSKGYDYDGVITSGKYKPIEGDCIITGRAWSQAGQTYGDMARRGIPQIPVYFMPPPWKAIGIPTSRREGLIATGQWKAMMIDETGVEEFFEDHPLQYETIVKHVKKGAKITKV